ncbi:LPS-assembly protein LptD [Sphingomonas solaris]|uniref:LPS-assembly protein LptD n=1 Tax=Alterirhizorhabdus solaris TaxID=2529389 RepID=A0A558R0J2_9SPHN|nr:LPS assembly protein LptD [Sphingomonas solaris]TVV72879.1 LPS-assembly protein LptD [Sphingomonas solaris]
MASSPARAQDLGDRRVPPPPAGSAPMPANDEEVTFSASALDYDDAAQIVTASGDVRMIRAGNRLRADKVIWNRKTGQVRAEGNLAVVNPGGDTAYGDSFELTDTLRDGVADNLLLVLEGGGRLAARHGERVNGVTTVQQAAYTPCAVVDSKGCPKNPVWKITAVRVVHDPVKHRISYKDARLTMFGATILWLPGLSHPDGSGTGGASGLLVPNFRYSRTNGLEVALPYYYQLAPNRDLTLTPHVYSEVLPALEAQYRALNGNGAYQLSGMITKGSRLPASTSSGTTGDRDSGVRGYIDVNGRFQLDPNWTISGSSRLVTDKTFLRRYDISRDDRLRSTINAERIDERSYLSIAGYATQSLRVNADGGQQPIALPAIDYRLRLTDPILGGRIELQANSLAILRTDGQDTQRAFAGARWELRRYTPLGQEVTFTAYGRADLYHTAQTAETITASYRGDAGWTGRGIAAIAADMRWPFVGEIFGGTQRLTPRVQVVASPPTRNLSIPNEDARAVDLEDSNLFALNRFPGYDRWEDGSRITYGAEWAFDRPRFALRTIVGQSYRLTDKPSIFPVGTGLSARYSDIVGRSTLQYGRFLEVTHRYRLDKSSLRIRRNEADVTLGSRRTYVTAAYLRLNRDIDTAIEDLRDREEVRLGGRVQFSRYWSVFGSTTIDLTGPGEDPVATGDGFSPVRHRLGLLYDDDCLELGVTWRRDYEQIGDARRGNTFLLRVALKNLGR